MAYLAGGPWAAFLDWIEIPPIFGRALDALFCFLDPAKPASQAIVISSLPKQIGLEASDCSLFTSILAFKPALLAVRYSLLPV